MSGLSIPLWGELVQPLSGGLLDDIKSAAKPLPVIDYLVMVGSSSTYHTYETHPILGNQLNPSRAAFCAEGIDVPIIPAGGSGATIADTKANIATIITNLGPIPTGKKVGILVHIGSNDIGAETYETATQAKRDQMRDDLIAILATIRNAGHEPILTTSTARNGDQDKFESWMNGLYHPLAVQETPRWARGGKCVFDYTQLYRDNLSTPNWYNPDNTHPWMATPAMQTYTAQKLKQYAKVPALGSKERFLFVATDFTAGGLNSAIRNGTLSSVVNWRGQSVAGVSLTTAATFGGTLGLGTWVRGNAGTYDVGLLHYSAHAANFAVSTPSASRQQWTANFGAAYAGRTGTLRATLNSNATPRRTRITLPDASFVDVQGETGIEVKEIPFTLNGSGSILVDMYRVTSGATAISGLEFEFDPV